VIATAAGVRLLDGAPRTAAAVAFAAVVAVLAFSGPYLLVPAAIAGVALIRRPRIMQSVQVCTEGRIRA
jgi:hypothetical protein